MTIPIPDEPEEFRYQWYDEKFEDLQAAGKCGEMQQTGSRCKSPILEWFDLDPDRPFPAGSRVGSCGTHTKMVGPRVKHMQESVYERRVKNYTENETKRIVRTLRYAGVNRRQAGEQLLQRVQPLPREPR